ncbi:phytochrome C [Anopheles sinensis]|uniref:Phytochrome C n=1 Tax=Anopheles sinensis TaxID=74873 RepID=A0A084WB24_ANOSI|nr:phytochrome C [Anopheles sinensis]
MQKKNNNHNQEALENDQTQIPAPSLARISALRLKKAFENHKGIPLERRYFSINFPTFPSIAAAHKYTNGGISSSFGRKAQDGLTPRFVPTVSNLWKILAIVLLAGQVRDDDGDTPYSAGRLGKMSGKIVSHTTDPERIPLFPIVPNTLVLHNVLLREPRTAKPSSDQEAITAWKIRHRNRKNVFCKILTQTYHLIMRAYTVAGPDLVNK